jgi:hypothetical protein
MKIRAVCLSTGIIILADRYQQLKNTLTIQDMFHPLTIGIISFISP